MVPSPEFLSVGKTAKSSQPLELDFNAGQDFNYDMKQTSRALEESPLAVPVYREVQMGQIPLLNELHQPKGGNKLWINFSEDIDGRRNAVIQMLWGSVLTQFHPSLYNNEWNVQTQGSGTTNKPIHSTELVSVIDSKLRKKDVFRSIADSAHFDPMTIPHLIHDNLYSTALERKKKLLYTDQRNLIQGLGAIAFNRDTPIISPEYVADVNTYFITGEEKGQLIQQLVTRTSYSVGDPTGLYGLKSVQKEYGYTVETPRHGYTKSGGYVAMSSRDGLSRRQIAEFTQLDQERNDPLVALRFGLDALRVAHRLGKSS